MEEAQPTERTKTIKIKVYTYVAEKLFHLEDGALLGDVVITVLGERRSITGEELVEWMRSLDGINSIKTAMKMLGFDFCIQYTEPRRRIDWPYYCTFYRWPEKCGDGANTECEAVITATYKTFKVWEKNYERNKQLTA